MPDVPDFGDAMAGRITRGSPGPESPSRRRLLKSASSVVTFALTPHAVWAMVRAGEAATKGSPAIRELLNAVCDLVIPATDTPGAVEAGVSDFVLLAVAHHLAGAEPGSIDRVSADLARRAGRDFQTLDVQRRRAVLESLDVEAFSERGRALPINVAADTEHAAGRDLADWRALKQLIVVGYYTSEPGATQELRYVFVPGRYDADIPFRPGDRALMNDWWGNTF